MATLPFPTLRHIVSVSALGATLLITACGGGRSTNPFEGGAPVGEGLEARIRIEVQNLNFNDATIWGMRRGQRVRVGRVTGKTDRTFSVDWNIAQPISFQVDVVSARTCSTGQIIVERNSRVWLTIPSDMGFGQCRAGRR